MPNPESARLIPKSELDKRNSEKTRLIPKNPERASVAPAEAGSQGTVENIQSKVTKKSEAEITERAHQDGKTITLKKLEAGMDPSDLRDSLEGQRDDIEATIEDLEESGDQPVVLDNAYMKREQLLAGIRALDEYEKGKKDIAA